MASSKIKGLTIAIGGETTGLDKALSGVNKKSKDLQSELREVEKLLKFDPSNTELLAQKQKLLSDAVQTSREKVDTLGTALEQAQEKLASGDIGEDQFRALQREVIKAEQSLDKFESQAEYSGDEIEKAGEKAKKSGDDAEKGVSGWEKLASTGGKAALAVGAAAGTAAVALGKEVVAQFSELEQNLGGSEAVFGEYANEIQKTGEDAYKNLGLSQSEYLATANKMGALFQGAGIEQQESLTLTTEAMQRAADMASVMGIDQSSAMEAVTGAAKGNYTMMDNLGVKMDDTSVKAYAMANGFSGVWAEASNSEKARYAMQMFFETTSQYAGNFARESEQTISGSIGMMEAALSSFTAGLGNPDADMQNLTQNLIDSFGAVVDNIKPVLENVVKALPEAIEGILPALDDLLPSIITTIINIFSEIVKAVIGLIPDLIPAIVEAGTQLIFSLVEGISETIPELVPAAIESVLTFVDTILDNIDVLVDAALAIMVGLANGIIDALPKLIEKIPEIVENLVTAIIENAPKLIAAAIEIIAILAVGIIENLPELIKAIVKIIPAIIEAIASGIGDLLSAMGEWASELSEWVKTQVPAIVAQIADFFYGLPGKIWDLIVDAVYAIGDWATDMIAKAKETIPEVISNIVEFFKELPENMKDVGVNMVKGIWEGIKSMAKWAKDKISDFANGLVDGVKNVLGIHSPSKVFAGIGGYMAEGLGNGFADQMRAVSKQISASIPTNFEDTLSYAAAPIRTPARAAQDTAQTNSTGAISNTANAPGAATAQPVQKIEIIFSGTYAQLARALNPIVKMGNNLVGPSLVEGIV